jgi:hypothetical protein
MFLIVLPPVPAVIVLALPIGFSEVAPVLVVGGCCSNGLRLGWYQSEKGVLWSSLHARVVKMPAPAGGPTRPALL